MQAIGESVNLGWSSINLPLPGLASGRVRKVPLPVSLLIQWFYPLPADERCSYPPSENPGPLMKEGKQGMRMDEILYWSTHPMMEMVRAGKE